MHQSADVETVVSCTIRAAFEYQGTSAVDFINSFQDRSVVLAPELTFLVHQSLSVNLLTDNLWPEIKKRLVEEISKIHMGQADGNSKSHCSHRVKISNPLCRLSSTSKLLIISSAISKTQRRLAKKS